MDKKGIHLFDKMYLFDDINFSTQDEIEKDQAMKLVLLLQPGRFIRVDILVFHMVQLQRHLFHPDNMKLSQLISLSQEILD